MARQRQRRQRAGGAGADAAAEWGGAAGPRRGRQACMQGGKHAGSQGCMHVWCIAQRLAGVCDMRMRHAHGLHGIH
eukprot:365377-Chlamydomonas_euryale.AAC.45